MGIELLTKEFDENIDGYISEEEFDKLYKRCIIDEREQEPKKLYYLIQFLMYDKEENRFITEEDTLELLYIRHSDKGFDKAIEEVFGKDPKNVVLTFDQYADKMHKLSLNKRHELLMQRKNYCELVVKTGKYKE
jgi:calmodulin